MSSSKPSREVHVIDVPDVGNFAARFVYNYHVPDEGSEAGAGVARNLYPARYFRFVESVELGTGPIPGLDTLFDPAFHHLHAIERIGTGPAGAVVGSRHHEQLDR